MNKKILCWLCIFCVWAGQPLPAEETFVNFKIPHPESVVGEIQAKGRNSVTIRDEQDKRLKRFTCLEDLSGFQEGQRVRIYYSPGDFVESIKQMTPVEYKPDGQNLGYLLKKE